MELEPEAANATVAEVYPSLCQALLDSGERLLCTYRRASLLSDGKKERSPVAVGDRVQVTPVGATDGVIEGRCSRSNQLSRPAPAREEKVHVLVANLQRLVIVTSADRPEFSPGIVDRFLVAAHLQGIEPMIVVNKMDLWSQPAEAAPWRTYQAIGYLVVELSAKQGRGVDPLKESLLDQTAAFCGHSGVGKTSLLRSLLDQDIGRVGQVSEQSGKGRHTTTGAVLLGGPGHSRWMDTPGVKEFGLRGLAPEDLRFHFPEFRELECQRRGCLHLLGDEDCQARALARHAGYLRIYHSLEAGEN